MKRFITILLVLTMLAGMGSVAHAEPVDSGNKEITSVGGDDSSGSVDVYGGFRAADNSPVYSISITWPEDMTFKYKPSEARRWDPVKHTYYDEHVGYDWTTQQLSIQIVNKSDVKVKVSATWAPEKELYDIRFWLEKDSIELGDAVVPLNNTGKITLSASNQNTKPSFTKVPQNAKVGTLTLTVEAVGN